MSASKLSKKIEEKTPYYFISLNVGDLPLTALVMTMNQDVF